MMFILCIWLMASGLFAVIGIAAWNAKKAVSFWNLTQPVRVYDVKNYNRAVAKMWFVFAGLFAVTGLPLLGGQNSAWIVYSILGCMALSIGLMVVYMRIEKKYRIY